MIVGGTKKAIFWIEGATLHYAREVGSVMTKIFSRKAHYVTFFENAEHFRRRESTNEDILSHVYYEGRRKVSTKCLW